MIKTSDSWNNSRRRFVLFKFKFQLSYVVYKLFTINIKNLEQSEF